MSVLICMSLLLTLFLYVCVCDRGIIAVVVCGDEVTAPTYFSVFKQIHSSNTKAAKDSSEFPNFFFFNVCFHSWNTESILFSQAQQRANAVREELYSSWSRDVQLWKIHTTLGARSEEMRWETAVIKCIQCIISSQSLRKKEQKWGVGCIIDYHSTITDYHWKVQII